MSEFIYIFIYSFIDVSSLIYIWHRLLNKKIDFKDKKNYITLISLMIISVLNFFLVNKFIKILLLSIVFMIFFRFLFKEKINKCIVTPLFYEILIMISETIYAILITLIFDYNATEIISTHLGTFMSNIMVSGISVAFIQFKFIRNLYNKIIDLSEKIKHISLMTLSLITMIFSSGFALIVYYKIEFKYLLIFNLAIIIICCIIVFISFRTQHNYNKVYDKYNIAIKSLNDYENMMNKYRVANHENKNLLLTIRAMIINKERDIPKFIDTMIEDKYEDDEKLLFKMAVIPSGGLRATIYSEILKIKEHNINYSLDIDKKLRTIDLIELDTNTIVDICKIIGVFIDNAIDEVKKLRTKNIDIYLYCDNQRLYIKVSNAYKSKIDLDKINNEGYTTKGSGHGYGLALIETIVKNNNLFEHNSEISKSIFSQIISIDYKKTHHN